MERLPARISSAYSDERAELLKCIGDLATNITLGEASKGLKKYVLTPAPQYIIIYDCHIARSY